MGLDIHGIRSILPHRYPFLLVDRVLEAEAGKHIVAIKNVTANEPFFTGHFPDNPVMPGVLILEALAQAGALLVSAGAEEEGGALGDGAYLYLAGIEKARFRRAVVPGDQLRLEATIARRRNNACWMTGRATVDGQLAASASMLSMLVDATDGVGQ